MRAAIHQLQAPGPQAMEKGQPWAVPGNQFRSFPTIGITQLDSIQKLFRSSEKRNPAIMSPKSMPDTASHAGSAREFAVYRDTLNPRYPEPDITHKVAPSSSSAVSLKIPKAAQASSGGFFDPNNWVFQIVWSHVGHMNIDQLSSFYFYREDRGKYGEHHTSTRGVAAYDDLDEETLRQAKGNENHRYQEQGRRVRHRCLQGESDKHISTSTLDMAQKELSNMKRIIQQMHLTGRNLAEVTTDENHHGRTVESRNSNTVSRKLGKDDQLAAGLMSQHVASILIFRQHEEITSLREELDAAFVEGKTLRLAATHCQCHLEQNRVEEEVTASESNAETVYWRQQFEQSEAERRNSEIEILRLRQQLRRSRSPQVSVQNLLRLPVPTARAGKLFDRMEEQSLPISPIQDVPEERPLKRRHCYLEPPKVAIQLNGQYRLPPSPTPSQDGSASSSSYRAPNWSILPHIERV